MSSSTTRTIFTCDRCGAEAESRGTSSRRGGHKPLLPIEWRVMWVSSGTSTNYVDVCEQCAPKLDELQTKAARMFRDFMNQGEI